MKHLVFALALLLVAACASAPRPAAVKLPPEEQVDPNERTLWAACKEGPGQPVTLPSDLPPHTPSCATPEPIKYNRAPVAVYAYGELAPVLARLSVLWWNQQLGFPVLRYAGEELPEGDDAEGILVFTRFEDGLLLGQAFPVWTGKVFICGAGVFQNTPQVDQTAIHEVGHCLGLAHDADNDGSVMYPYMTGKPYRATPADREALRKLYGLRP